MAKRQALERTPYSPKRKIIQGEDGPEEIMQNEDGKRSLTLVTENTYSRENMTTALHTGSSWGKGLALLRKILRWGVMDSKDETLSMMWEDTAK